MQSIDRTQSSNDSANGHQPDIHYLHWQLSLPAWLGKSSNARRQALKETRPALPLKLQSVSPSRLAQLTTLNTGHLNAQNEVDQLLAQFRDVNAFAEPLLKAEIKARFDLDLDVKSTFLRLYVPQTAAIFPVKTGARTWTLSLLDAALHNFEEKETRENAFEAPSTFITEPSASGQFDTLPWVKAKISIEAFTAMCRELDIGAQYKRFLDEHLGITDAEKGAALRKQVDKSQKAALKAALHFARINGDISATYFRTINALIDGVPNLRIARQPVSCHALTMMSAPLTGPIIFGPGPDTADESGSLARIVAYVPDDPQHPVKEYASSADFEKALTDQLRSADYRKFFSRFINHEQRGAFFAALNARLGRVKWHEPVRGSSEPVWRDEPFDKPDLQLYSTPISNDLWQHLYESKLDKILNDARVIAVATASVDTKTRWALWDSLVGIASTILQAAAFVIAPFVPVLGEMMMAYMAYQFLDEVFEGIVEWAQGQTAEAIQHLIGTVDSLLQLGMFAVGGAIAVGEFRKVLPKEVVAFIDRFKPVRLDNGQTRYWDADLSRYQQKSLPPAGSKPSKLGLHEVQGKQILPLEDAHYAVRQSTTPGQYRIEHPTRPNAYKPVVRHNGDGAWHTELETPLQWDKATTLRRTSHEMEAFTPAQREQILHVSGYNENALRKMHVDREPMPPLLADSITRWRIDRDLQVFIDQLASDQPEQYCAADPATQLQLLAEHGRWPANQRLRLLDAEGATVWQSSSDETLPFTDLHQDNLLEGDLLKTLLRSLDEAQAKALLGEDFGDPELSLQARSRKLRAQLLQLGKAQRGALFEARYQAETQVDDPLHTALAQYDPALPPRVTQEVLDTTSSDELLQISEGQLPPRQQALMDMASEEVRVARAYEGLLLDSVNNPDTDTLALHSLRNVPGWSGDVRLEIRDGRYEGRMLDSTGRADAPEQKVLVRQSDGRYQPFDDRGQQLHSASDLYSSILYALPDAERQALDIGIGEAAKLKNAIRAQPLERSELRLAIALEPVPEPTVDTLRLLGREGYRQMEPFVDAPSLPEPTRAARVQEILRGFSIEEARAFATRFTQVPRGLTNELARLRSEFSEMSATLRRWETDIPVTDPHTRRRLTPTERRAAQRSRAALRDVLERCWRRETRDVYGYALQIRDPITGDLPALRADFSHVRSLVIDGSVSTRAIDPFLQRFPQLISVEARNLHLPDLPQALASMPALRRLVIRNSRITMSPANRSLLESLPQLSFLDLARNPLGGPLDIHKLPALGYLNLDNTGISVLPDRLLEHPGLVTGRFAGNQIREIPEAFSNLNGTLADGFSLAGNPLSPTTRDLIKNYYRRTHKHFGVLPEQTDIDQAITLFPSLSVDDAVEVIYQLPGSLAQGRAQFSAWETEFSRLQSDLADWMRDIPQHAPATGEPLNINEQTSELLARAAFSDKLQSFWRERWSFPPFTRSIALEATLGFMGDMPLLDADFGHVLNLTLRGNKNVSGMLAFLQRFQNLTLLDLRRLDLDPGTLSILDLPELHTLKLNDCGVVMTPENEARLLSMTNLTILDLSNNPLGTFPDFNLLPELSHIDLSNTGLSNVPAGLADHAGLEVANFSGNLISTLPDVLFELPATRANGMDFADNPLSAAMRDRIKTYHSQTGQDFDVLADPADIALARQLFPSLDKVTATDLIYTLPGSLADSRTQLMGWHEELRDLQADLDIWADQVPTHHPVIGATLSAAEMQANRASRADFAQQLVSFWRSLSADADARDDVFEATLTFQGDLPVLRANFDHVARITLRGNPDATAVGAFVGQFPYVDIVQLHDFALGEIPQTLSSLPELKDLTLANCNLTLTAQGQSVLESLSELERLDLSHNALGQAPDIANMPLLNDLRLSDTAIDTLPNGIATHPNLRTANLDGNAITELPEDFFALNRDLADDTDLSNNPLSSTARDRIKAYYREADLHFGVLPDLGDITLVTSLFSGLSNGDAIRIIYRLPGTLADSHAQLLRWRTEFARMHRDLDAWSQRASLYDLDGQVMSMAERTIQLGHRRTFSQQIEQFWRNRYLDGPDNPITAMLFYGDLPAIEADFSHVTQFALTGNKGLKDVNAFLRSFTRVRVLELRDFALGRFPENIAPSVETLLLSNCGMVFDETGQAALSSLTQLESLDLYDNPLRHPPDISLLPNLKYIDLASTQIDRLPTGLTGHPRLRTAILSDNNITELPQALFELPGDVSLGFDLSNNPLSPTARDLIKNYRQTKGGDFSVSIEAEDIELAHRLYPRSSPQSLSDIVYSLPGTLAEGRAELVRRQTEIATLSSDLEAWANLIPLDNLTGEPVQGLRLEREAANRQQFKERLEQCWRRIVPEGGAESEFSFNLPLRGELPALSADFGHITVVKLICNDLEVVPQLGQFLAHFPHLRSLTIQRYLLGNIPEVVLRMTDLTALSLSDCGITLTPQTVSALGGMNNLSSLTLRGSYLKQTPDLRHMTALTWLDLSRTLLKKLPPGILDRPYLRYADLSYNHIRELPEELANRKNTHFVFTGNDLSETAKQILADQNLARLRAGGGLPEWAGQAGEVEGSDYSNAGSRSGTPTVSTDSSEESDGA
ncbi:leucine-rich repeat domain-containing protein [Pseudomonas sp. SWRI81]|uniref:leucine-rich repeat domain-containing protein n=1 Tax=Pseudomonas sp. SWRI81 TaxID=2745505 RepID=UPI00164503A9|nr:leucine-rich repeat domain-containing protein [Pseudomonas sp. SWRI81]MBC3271893.1 leucine-rich repeat domain-containing protein [Pseudomonas sp. SWRI81]